jgi:Ca2+-binding EF-hand superfamily protein
MSGIGNVGSYVSSAMSQDMRRPDPSRMVDKLFSQLDAQGKGYLEKSDLQSAFSQIPNSRRASDGASVDDVFNKLDGNGDGKVTKDEMSDSLKKLAAQLDSQFDRMRMSSGAMPPPPPPGGGKEGPDLSKEQLVSMANETSSTDTERSALFSSLANNFDKADADGDGKVSFKEAMAYDRSTRNASAGTNDQSNTSVAASGSAPDSEQAIMKRIMELVHAYSGNDSNRSSLSTSA